jgi:hypothetical protein
VSHYSPPFSPDLFMKLPPSNMATLTLLLCILQSAAAFVSPAKVSFISISRSDVGSSNNDASDNDPLLTSEVELDQFEKDLLAAFGDEDQDEAVTNAAFAAFARDLQNVDEIDEWGKWNDDITDDEFLISEQEAFELYTETMEDMAFSNTGEVELDLLQIPDEEKQLVEDMIATANRAIESIWGEQGMSNPVREYFNNVKKARQDGGECENDTV